jgi:hypothetical protein
VLCVSPSLTPCQSGRSIFSARSAVVCCQDHESARERNFSFFRLFSVLRSQQLNLLEFSTSECVRSPSLALQTTVGNKSSNLKSSEVKWWLLKVRLHFTRIASVPDLWCLSVDARILERRLHTSRGFRETVTRNMQQLIRAFWSTPAVSAIYCAHSVTPLSNLCVVWSINVACICLTERIFLSQVPSTMLTLHSSLLRTKVEINKILYCL